MLTKTEAPAEETARNTAKGEQTDAQTAADRWLAEFQDTLNAGSQARLGPLFGFGAIVYAAHLLRQPFALKPDDPAGALRLFRSNRDAALILLAAIAAGAWRVTLW